MEMSVAVIGAGNGGTAIAGYLASVGANVRLCDLFPEYLEGIRAAGGIDLTLEGDVYKRQASNTVLQCGLEIWIRPDTDQKNKSAIPLVESKSRKNSWKKSTVLL